MAHYHAEVGYRTKRGGTAVGLTVKAFGPDEAEDVAREYVIGKHRARQWIFTKIREVTASDISLGVLNECVPASPRQERGEAARSGTQREGEK